MATYFLNDISIVQITSLFLYGQESRPANLVDETLIRLPEVPQTQPAMTDVHIDAVLFMTTGAGRFANGSMSPLVDAFMSEKILQTTGSRQEFSLVEIAAIVTPKVSPGSAGFFGFQPSRVGRLFCPRGM